MCAFTFDKLRCPDCQRARDGMFSTPSTQRGLICKWARFHWVQPFTCPWRHDAWSGAWAATRQPCAPCRRNREASRAKVESWARLEEAWREQNPLEDRVGEDVPEADRGWQAPPGRSSDDAGTTAEQEEHLGPRSR